MLLEKNLLGSFLVGFFAVALAGCGNGNEVKPAGMTDPCANQVSGSACTWAGLKGQTGFNGDGHQRYETQVNSVQDMVFLPDGSAWFSDFNNYLVRKVLPDGIVESVVGWTDPPFPGDGPVGGVSPAGADGADWQLNHPTSLILAPDGSVILVGWHNHKLLTIDPATGWVKVVCGAGAGFKGDGGPANLALFKQPSDATFDDQGNLYVVDQQNQRIRKIDTNDMIATVAGTGTYGTDGDGGPALMAQFSWAFGSNPNPSGGILFHEGRLYISNTESNTIRVMDLATGIVDAFAGTGEKGYSGDGGAAKMAQLSAPRDLEIGPDGDLYFADTDNGCVRAINLGTGMIRTVAGTGELGLDDEENKPATQTKLRRPFGLAFDADGNLYIMDSLNDRIVKVAK